VEHSLVAAACAGLQKEYNKFNSMENTIPQTSSKHSPATVSTEHKASDVERTMEDAAMLLLRLRQLGDYGLRRSMQFLTENE
jgi:hypothetical protein